MLTFLRIERPTRQTLRPSATAASMTCCTRWMFEANDVVDDPAPAAREHALQVRADHGLAHRRPRPVGVRGVAAQQQHPVAPQLGQPRHVGRRAADRRLVELVVAGEQHGPELAAQDHADHVGDRVRQVDELDLERPRLDLLARREHLEVGLAQPVLVELGARHRDRQLAAVDHRHRRLPQLAQHPRQRADVVLVAVGDDDRLDVVDVLAQVGEVRQHEVDAHHLGGREAQPAVDHDDRAVVLDDGHVLADLADAPEREDAQGAAHAVAARWSSPWRSSIARTSAISCSSASTIGRRQPPRRARAGSAPPSCRSGWRSGRAWRRRRAATRRSRPAPRARRTSASSRPRRCARRRRCRRRRPGRGSRPGCRRCRPARRARRSAAARRSWPA